MWEKIVNNLSQQLTSPQLESWIKPIKFLHSDDCNIFLAVPNDYSKNWVTKKLSKQISSAILQETGQNLKLNIEVDSSLEVITSMNDAYKQSAEEANKSVGERIANLPRLAKGLNPKHTFDTFIYSPNNKFAYAIARAVSENPGNVHNPLFLYGGVGLGKTHLMQSIGHEIIKKHHNLKVKYSSMENFANELIESIRRKTTSEFRSHYRQIDVLLLDDVQFLEKKEATQDELFNTFNDLYQSGKQIVLSSDKHPKDIPDLPDRLVSRFQCGIIVDVQPPDLETRIAILQNKSKRDKMDIPFDVLELIALSYQNNVRELEGTLNRVIAFVGVMGCSMTVDSVRGMIDSTSKAKNMSPDNIIEQVAEYYKVTASEIKGSSRKQEVSNARQVCIYLIREVSQLSFPAIGDIFYKKHSTIMYSYDKVKEEMASNRSFAEVVSGLLRKVT